MISFWRSLRRFGVAGLAFAVLSLLAGLAAADGLLDPAALLITLGGSLGVLSVTYSRRRLTLTWALLGEALTLPADPERTIATMKQLGQVYRVDGIPALESAGGRAGDPFLRAAIALTVDAADESELREELLGEARREAAEGESARQVLVTLGRLFPAFGLIGTLLGLVNLMRHLGGADLSAIGPGLGMAVLTTLYGAVLSNVVVLPLTAKLQGYLARRTLLTQMVIEGALLIHRREYPTRIERALRAYLGIRYLTTLSDDRTLRLERAA